MRSVLWVDDEADLLEPHGIFLREKGFDVAWVQNADDAVELLRRHNFDILLLDEQMPGKSGLQAYRELREVAPGLPVVMVTKSEDESTMRDALGVRVSDYLVKPVNPRQVLAAVTRILDGRRIRQEAVSREFVTRFRELEMERQGDLDWRGWTDRYCELMRWDIDLADAGEMGLYDSLRSLYPHVQRDFAAFVKANYAEWLAELDGDRPPLSVDIIGEFLTPVLRDSPSAMFVVVDCMRMDQWFALEPLIAEHFEIETAFYYSILPTATPYSRNALFSGLFPSEIAARFPDWWGDRDDESLNLHEKDLLSAHLSELGLRVPVRYEKISSAAESQELERNIAGAIGREGVSAFVFNFVDLLTHGRSESAILREVARDEIALRQLTVQWFQRSALFKLLQEAARSGVPVLLTSDHGSIHCNTPATVFARRDATQNLRFKFGEDLRSERPEQALLYRREDLLRLPRRGNGVNTLLATGDAFFVYPTKLREYQGRYRGSFLHGGVSPEEMILPAAHLIPRR